MEVVMYIYFLQFSEKNVLIFHVGIMCLFLNLCSTERRVWMLLAKPNISKHLKMLEKENYCNDI